LAALAAWKLLRRERSKKIQLTVSQMNTKLMFSSSRKRPSVSGFYVLRYLIVFLTVAWLAVLEADICYLTTEQCYTGCDHLNALHCSKTSFRISKSMLVAWRSYPLSLEEQPWQVLTWEKL